ncbi:MAG: M12 family metallo-peptidase [Saprospiraceae bacterium]|nr:M12 family metallo-peptidase [Saprospiraceae bacterium]
MKKLFLSAALLFPVLLLFSQNSWHDVAETGISLAGERRIIPRQYRTVAFDLDALQPLLASAPLRFSPQAAGNTLEIELPTPDGRTSRFLLFESPVMRPDYQAQNPDIRCYTGIGIDEPGATLKCDLTPHGFHAMVLRSKNGAWFIDPYSQGDRTNYVVYYKKDYPRPADKTWFCETTGEGEKVDENRPATEAGDCKLREYALALACTGEYAGFHGGTVPAARAAMVTSLNRVNGVFEHDFAVTMFLVSNNDTLIFLNGATDPYTNNDGVAMLGQNQTTCNNRIGNANYDIGHVFSTGGGGVASLASVCSAANKARGVTGGSSPVGDPFDIDYVAHEMGHQFNCAHTFNGTHGSCNGNRSLPSAYEPGSGSTIMGYAGICDDQDVQPNSDPYFHARSLQQAATFVTGGGHTCDTETITGNDAPTVNAGADYTIPKSTPFVLTASGSDPDGDAIRYCWEQYNNEDSVQPPLPTNTGGPNFRSLNPTPEAERYFPNLDAVVSNASPTWEVLPSVARTLNFRVTVRDYFGGAGCTGEDNMVVTVSGAAGPFRVTQPNTAVTWQGGTTQTITWDVSGTSGGAVNCANVEIALSTDGGFNYPEIILASTPNDGTQNVTIPNLPSTTCRIRVRGVGNIFYDISNVNFIITAAAPVELLSFDARLQDKNNVLLQWATATEKDNAGFEIQHAVKNGPTGSLNYEVKGFVDGNGNSTQRRDYSFELRDLPAGEHYFRLRQIDYDGKAEYSPAKSVNIRPALLVTAAPNPVKNTLILQISQEKTAEISIELHNQWGHSVPLLSPREVAAGDTQWRFDLSEYPAGAYYVVCRQGNAVSERKLILRQ